MVKDGAARLALCRLCHAAGLGLFEPDSKCTTILYNQKMHALAREGTPARARALVLLQVQRHAAARARALALLQVQRGRQSCKKWCIGIL